MRLNTFFSYATSLFVVGIFIGTVTHTFSIGDRVIGSLSTNSLLHHRASFVEEDPNEVQHQERNELDENLERHLANKPWIMAWRNKRKGTKTVFTKKETKRYRIDTVKKNTWNDKKVTKTESSKEGNFNKKKNMVHSMKSTTDNGTKHGMKSDYSVSKSLGGKRSDAFPNKPSPKLTTHSKSGKGFAKDRKPKTSFKSKRGKGSWDQVECIPIEVYQKSAKGKGEIRSSKKMMSMKGKIMGMMMKKKKKKKERKNMMKKKKTRQNSGNSYLRRNTDVEFLDEDFTDDFTEDFDADFDKDYESNTFKARELKMSMKKSKNDKGSTSVPVS